MATNESKSLYHVGFGFGHTMPYGTTVAEMVRAAGLDHRVEKRPLMAVLDEETAVEVPGRYATIRMDTGAALGVVGERYEICQNEMAWTIPSLLEAEGRFTVQSAAAFKGGAHVMLTGKVATEVIRRQDGSGDEMSGMLVFSNGHNGKRSVQMGFTHRRHVCDNQNVAILRGLQAEHRIRHASNLEIRVAEANEAILIAEDALAKGRDLFQQMADTKMTVRQFRTFASDLLNAVKGTFDEEDGKRNARESEDARKALVDELTTYFGESPGNQGNSLWDGYNSITYWLDHKLERYEESKRTAKRIEAHLSSTYFGRARGVKEKAVRLLGNKI